MLLLDLCEALLLFTLSHERQIKCWSGRWLLARTSQDLQSLTQVLGSPLGLFVVRHAWNISRWVGGNPEQDPWNGSTTSVGWYQMEEQRFYSGPTLQEPLLSFCSSTGGLWPTFGSGLFDPVMDVSRLLLSKCNFSSPNSFTRYISYNSSIDSMGCNIPTSTLIHNTSLGAVANMVRNPKVLYGGDKNAKKHDDAKTFVQKTCLPPHDLSQTDLNRLQSIIFDLVRHIAAQKYTTWQPNREMITQIKQRLYFVSTFYRLFISHSS